MMINVNFYETLDSFVRTKTKLDDNIFIVYKEMAGWYILQDEDKR